MEGPVALLRRAETVIPTVPSSMAWRGTNARTYSAVDGFAAIEAGDTDASLRNS